jgi:hypothetical protein
LPISSTVRLSQVERSPVMSIQKPQATTGDISARFPKVSDQEAASPIAPLDDQDPEDKAGSYAAHVGGEPTKGGRSSGIVGQTRQRTGSAQSKKNPRSVGRAAPRKSTGQ